MSTLTQAPSATILTPGTLAPCGHLDVGRDSLQCSACLKWVHLLCSFLTRADFRTFCATGTAVGWRCPACHPQKKTGSPTQTQSPCYAACVPSPRFPPTTTWLLSLTFHLGASHVTPCSICSLEVGKDSLKCYTCSKWVHFSCSSLTRADFRKICAAGSPMGWNCPACLNGDLASPTHWPASPPASSLQLCPHPLPLHLLAQILWIHLCLYLTSFPS